MPGTKSASHGAVEFPDRYRAELVVGREPCRRVERGEVPGLLVIPESIHLLQDPQRLGPSALAEDPVVHALEDPLIDRFARFARDLAMVIVGQRAGPRRTHGEGPGGIEERREHRIGVAVGLGDRLRLVEERVAAGDEGGVPLPAGVLDGLVAPAAERRVIPVDIDRAEALGADEAGDDFFRFPLEEIEVRSPSPELPVELGERSDEELQRRFALVGVTAGLARIEDEAGDHELRIAKGAHEARVVCEAQIPAEDEERFHFAFGNQGTNFDVLAL